MKAGSRQISSPGLVLLFSTNLGLPQPVWVKWLMNKRSVLWLSGMQEKIKCQMTCMVYFWKSSSRVKSSLPELSVKWVNVVTCKVSSFREKV